MNVKENYPELNDFLTEMYKDPWTYSRVKEAIQIISEVVRESGINIYDIRELLSNAEVHCEDLELKDKGYEPSLEFITQQCKSINDLFKES